MALCAPHTAGSTATSKLFDLSALADFDTRRAPIYRCTDCGSEIPFDALTVTCQCVDDVDTLETSSAQPRRAA
jgi:hypothetical protein